MPTLNEVVSETKIVFKWGGIALGFLLFIYFITVGWGLVKEIFYPSEPPAPTVGFGKLEPVQFPTSKEEQTFEYSIDTLTGTLPSFPDRGKVFKMNQPEADLLAMKKTQEKVNGIAFYSQPVKISKDLYKWTDVQKITRELSYNLLTSDFTMTSSYLSDENVLRGASLPDVETAKSMAKFYLENIQASTNDLDLSKTIVKFFAISSGSLVPTTHLAGSQVIQLFFVQSNVDEKSIYYPDPNSSPISVSIASGESQPQVVSANFYHQTVSDKSETYPLKSSQEAFDELKSGSGYVASYTGTGNNISIRNISLGYYIGETKQNYLIPIIVFEGEDDFMAYVPAVKDEWLDN